MKVLGILLLAALSAAGQEAAVTLSQPLEHEIGRLVREKKIAARQTAPNEVRSGRFIYSGIAVQLARSSQPLQLLNPAAPERYGIAYQNVVMDPISGRATGLKVFSIKF